MFIRRALMKRPTLPREQGHTVQRLSGRTLTCPCVTRYTCREGPSSPETVQGHSAFCFNMSFIDIYYGL